MDLVVAQVEFLEAYEIPECGRKILEITEVAAQVQVLEVREQHERIRKAVQLVEVGVEVLERSHFAYTGWEGSDLVILDEELFQIH